MTYCLNILIKTLMFKSCSKCKQTNIGTSDGLEQVNRLNGPDGASWSNTDLNAQTGDLTISNIQRDQTGVYKLEINTSSMILHRKIYIAVGGAKKKLVMMGESIALHTSVIEVNRYDLVLWKFEDHVMAEINKGADLFSLHGNSDERFNGRLDLDRQTGDLIIRSIQITDSGVYQLHMSNSSHTIQRNITVTVSDPGPHTNNGALKWGLAVVIGLLVAFALGIILYCCIKKRRDFKQVPSQEKNDKE